MRCITCGSFFKITPYNSGPECNDCVDTVFTLEEDIELEVELLKNRSGKTKAVFYDDNQDEDSHGL